MTQTEALRLALRALQEYERYTKGVMIPQTQVRGDEAITAIKAALANEALERKAENARELGLDYEPWEKFCDSNCVWTDHHPDCKLAQRTWQGLTDEEIVLIVAECAASHQHTDIHFARAIEAKLRSKNYD